MKRKLEQKWLFLKISWKTFFPQLLRIRIPCMALALFLTCSCTDTSYPESGSDSIPVYRVLRRDLQTSGELLRAEPYPIPPDGDPIEAAIKLVIGSSGNAGLESAFPEEIKYLSFSISEENVSVFLSREYKELSAIDRSIADYCMTLTLCSLPDISTVSIYADGELQNAGMTPEDAVLSSADTNPAEKQLRLYFPMSHGRYLDSEIHNLNIEEGLPMGGYVLNELLRGPYNENLSASVPRGTKLLDTETIDGICIVNLSGEFYEGRPDNLLDGRLAVYSIVNSLTSLSEINGVRILIEGGTVEEYCGIPISEPLEKNESAIGPPIRARGEEDISIYLSFGDDGALVKIPCIILSDAGISPEQNALSALVSAKGEPGINSLFSSEDKNILASTTAGICTVTLPSEFFSSRGGAREISLSLAAITATAISLGNADYVRFQTDAPPESYKGVELGGLHTTDNEIIINY